jgi:hypothetical protein
MRRNAATAAAMTLALLCGSALSVSPLLAKPTRTLTRATAHKLVLTQPMHRASRSRTDASARSASLHPHHSTSQLRSEKRSGDLAAARSVAASGRGQSERRQSSKRRTLVEERAAAAQAAIDAADHRSLALARSQTPQRNRLRSQRASLVASRPPRESAQDYPATVDETPPPDALTSPTTLTNIGGVLRATPGSLAVTSMPNTDVAPLLFAPLRLSSLYDSGGRLILPRPLYGSHEILLHQNEMADRDGLDRVQDDADLLELRREKKLVALPESEALHVDYRLPEDRRYSRPWTAAFLSLLAADFYATFHAPLQVDSAVRTVAVQRRLLRTNGNAASITGEAASPHLTGQAVDIAKGGLNLAQIAWMRTYLQPLIDVGKIDVEEEFQQSCFHISVYKSFQPSAAAHVSLATAGEASPVSEPERPSY